MESDWDILEDDQEIEIIRKHANFARLFTTASAST